MMIQKSKEEVQSLIINISFPRNLDNLYEIVENGGLMDVEILIDDPEEYSWTVSKWVKPDDVAFVTAKSCAYYYSTFSEIL